MDFSEQVRHRVYAFVGISTELASYHGFRPSETQRGWWELGSFSLNNGRDYNRQDLATYLALTLSNRTISAEVTRTLWSARTQVAYKDKESLAVLYNLRPETISYIRNITIDLHSNLAGSETPSLLNTFSVSLSMEWRKVVERLSLYLTPSAVNFRFICEVDTVKQASEILETLKNLPPLSGCSIRLGNKPNFTVTSLIKLFIEQLTVQKTILKTPFRYMDLPMELQLRILEYTELVTRFCEVEWNPVDKFLLREFSCNDLPPVNTLNFVGDTTCLTYGTCKCFSHASNDCFCPKVHAAFSSHHMLTPCHCWQSPLSFFLVSRAFRSAALQIFFSKNRFVITAYQGHFSGNSHTIRDGEPVTEEVKSLESHDQARLELGQFLRVIPREALQHLRRLGAVFTPFDQFYLPPGSEVQRQFQKELTEVLPWLNIPALTIDCFINLDYIIKADFRKPYAWQNNVDLPTALVCFRFLFEQLLDFKFAKGFYVHGVYLVHDYYYDDYSNLDLSDQVESLEAELEEIVRGSDSLPNSRIKQLNKDDSSWYRASSMLRSNDCHERWCCYGIYVANDW
jgi:hypothetical protein